MTTYTVGPDGALVYAADGRMLGSLPPGVTVVPAVEGVPARWSADAEPPERIADGKRIRGYADKALRVTEDR